MEELKEFEILLVEDDPSDAELTLRALRQNNLANKVRWLKDGEEALDYLFRRGAHAGRDAGSLPKLIMLDIKMPKVDGIEVLRRIKSDPELSRLPIIMLTTTDDSREVERCYELGCSVYIQKPVDYDRFAEAIRRLGLFVPLLLVPSMTGR
jgi:two-component system, response regulator